ncbi:PPC domain-containing protein [Hymenobacter terricola]|uniref:PPC domain-containing protein n=1 Tax=Hymenobacter terricola TaxID=2819236 RepID=UPI001B30B78B|nr:PPC domain-containing protein [Hymenobacter terricola]
MSRLRLFFLLLSGQLALSLVGNAQTKSAGSSTVLKPGKSISQTLQSGQAFDYQVALKAGQALKATVEQKGVDVLVTAYGPDGAKLATFDSPTSTAYKEFVTVLAPTTGRYRLSVTNFDPKAPAGTFVMTLDGILTPAQYAQSQADDRKRADAVAAYLQAPHPDKTAYEQREEMLRLDPTAYMLAATAAETATARWLEGTWTANQKLFATPTEPEIVFPPRTTGLRFDAQNPTMLQIDPRGDGKFEPFLAFEPHSRQWVHAALNTDEVGTSWSLLKGPDWQNDQLVLQGETALMGITAQRRQTWTKTDDHNLRVLSEERKGDGAWAPVSETLYTKTMLGNLTTK